MQKINRSRGRLPAGTGRNLVHPAQEIAAVQTAKKKLDRYLGFSALSSVPTVLTIRNVRVVIYANDHPPAHVHLIRRDGARAKFALNCPQGPVMLVEQIGFRLAEIVDIGSTIATELTAVCVKWRAIHG